MGRGAGEVDASLQRDDRERGALAGSGGADPAEGTAERLGIRLIVTGGRKYDNEAFLFECLDAMHRKHGIAVVAHGATPSGEGADWLAEKWAKARGVPVERFEVNIGLDGKWPGAGPNRNRRMGEVFKPDCVAAFPGKRGTTNMCRWAMDAGIPVWMPEDPHEGRHVISDSPRR